MTERLARLSVSILAASLIVAVDAAAQDGYAVLHSFAGGAAGSFPRLLVEGSDRNLYGITDSGGAADRGTIFQLTPAGAFRVLHSFDGSAAGGGRPNNFIQAADGDFYGTTLEPNTFFRLAADGGFTVLHLFSEADGEPRPGLIQASDGNFYGASLGDPHSVFRLTAAGDFTALSAFSGRPSRVIEGSDGYLYGAYGFATIFRMTLDGVVTPLHTFPAFSVHTSQVPSGLVEGEDGSFYGTLTTTLFGQTIFKLTLTDAGTEVDLFANTRANLSDGFSLAAGGILYGVADIAGPVLYLGGAAVLELTPAGDLTTVWSFDKVTILSGIRGMDGRFYGTEYSGGDSGHGIVFRLTLVPPAIARQPISRRTSAGRVVRFFTAAVGVPEPAYRWQSSADGGISWSDLVDSDIVRGATTDTLLIAGARPEHDGTQYRCVTTNRLGAATSAAATLAVLPVVPEIAGDFDGDGRSDTVVFRPFDGMWHTLGRNSIAWGGVGDVPVPRDYSGDATIDVAVFRPATGIWYIRGATVDEDVAVPWGGDGDIPVPADYFGDGAADIAVFRPSTGRWYIRGAAAAVTWGGAGDIPVPGDYDGDGVTEIAVFRPSTGVWYIRGATATVTWGGVGDIPVQGDYDGDGIAEIAVFRPSTGVWHIRDIRGAATAVSWGGIGDTPVPGDYDGSGTIDIAVFRPSTGTWYVREAVAAVAWGADGDVPVLGRR